MLIQQAAEVAVGRRGGRLLHAPHLTDWQRSRSVICAAGAGRSRAPPPSLLLREVFHFDGAVVVLGDGRVADRVALPLAARERSRAVAVALRRGLASDARKI